jgi:hypothetical protein
MRVGVDCRLWLIVERNLGIVREGMMRVLPRRRILWAEMLGGVVGLCFYGWDGEWRWELLYWRVGVMRGLVRGGVVDRGRCVVGGFLVRRLALNRGRHWDRKRRTGG